MRITVAGIGYVGLVTCVCLAEMGYQVTCFDNQTEKIKRLKEGNSQLYEPGLEELLKKNLQKDLLYFTDCPREAFSQAEIIFITVGTPEMEGGMVNLQYVYEVVTMIAGHINGDVIICMKSTVPIGTNEEMKKIIDTIKPPYLHIEVLSNPEFLREGSAILDFFHGNRIVIGSDNPEATSILEEIYSPLNIPILKTDIRSAEMIKYASNAFLATKISFINEIASLCENVGADIEEVAYGIGLDERIGSQFLQAGIGFGGSCFPKDTKALVRHANDIQERLELLEAVINVNNRQQSWAVKKAKEILGTVEGKRIALLGLAFKPNTDDVREAPAIKIAKELVNEGARIVAYDPIAVENAKKELGSHIAYTNNIIESLYGAELAIIATEWDTIKYLPLEKFKKHMTEAIIIDGRNCYSVQDIQKHGIDYYSIGRMPITNILKKA